MVWININPIHLKTEVLHNRLKNTFGFKLEQKNKKKHFKLSIHQIKNYEVNGESVKNKFTQDISLMLQRKLYFPLFHNTNWSINANIKKNDTPNIKFIIGWLTFDVFKHSLLFKSGNIKNSHCSIEFKASTFTPFKPYLQAFQKSFSIENKSDKKDNTPKTNKKQQASYQFIPESIVLKYDFHDINFSIDYNFK